MNIKYSIEKKVGVLSENNKGWSKEINLVSWNDRPAKYDIRDWDKEHSKMGKGITMTEEELKQLKQILNTIEL